MDNTFISDELGEIIPNNESYFRELAEELIENGVIVLTNNDFSEKLKIFQKAFDKVILDSPEFKQPERFFSDNKSHRPAYSGFAILGNPSSYHHPIIRQFREYALKEVYRLFKYYLDITYPNDKSWNLEYLSDAIMLRKPGQKPQAEAWHRDFSTHYKLNDDIFGGWLNLDNTSQNFSCILETHKEVKHPLIGGFNKIDVSKYSASKKKLINVPPGGIIIFFQHIVHEIHPISVDFFRRRMFLGWRITQRKDNFFNFTENDKRNFLEWKKLLNEQEIKDLDQIAQEWHYKYEIKSINKTGEFNLDINKILENQDIIPLKSGQLPRMAPKMTYYTNNTSNWSVDNFQPEYLYEHTTVSGKNAGDSKLLVKRFMDKLLPKDRFRPYNQSELDIFFPRRTWTLTDGSQITLNY